MSRPDTLTAPPLCTYPFINLIFLPPDKNLPKIIFAYEHSLIIWPDDDRNFRNTQFLAPDQVGADKLALLDWLNDHTFENLIGKAQLQINDVDIRTKNDLFAAASNTSIEWDACLNREGKASIQQLCAYLLFDHSSHACFHWGSVANLYNDSAPDQQDAILSFFEKFLNRPLESLLSLTFPAPLPELVGPALEQKSVDGIPYVLSPVDNDWVREDQALNRFTVNGFRGQDRRSTYLIAGAATLEEAMAYATRYAIEIQAKDSIQRIAIDYLGEEVCSAKIAGMGPKPTNAFDHALPVRLEWNLEQISSFMGKNEYRDTLIRTEKKMGVGWSKVRRLEDELGL